MTVHVLMVFARDRDPEPHLYADDDAAYEAAREAALEMGCVEQEEAPEGWSYAAYHEEGDAVMLTTREIIS